MNSSEEKSRDENSLRKGGKYDNILIYQNMTDHKQYLIRNLFYQSQNHQNHSHSYDTPDSSFNASRSGAGVAQNLAQKFRNVIDREYSPKRPRREYLGHPPPESPSKPPNTEIAFDQQIYVDDQKTKIRGPKEILKVFSPNKRPRRGNRSQDPVRDEQNEFEFAAPEPLQCKLVLDPAPPPQGRQRAKQVSATSINKQVRKFAGVLSSKASLGTPSA